MQWKKPGEKSEHVDEGVQQTNGVAEDEKGLVEDIEVRVEEVVPQVEAPEVKLEPATEVPAKAEPNEPTMPPPSLFKKRKAPGGGRRQPT